MRMNLLHSFDFKHNSYQISTYLFQMANTNVVDSISQVTHYKKYFYSFVRLGEVHVYFTIKIFEEVTMFTAYPLVEEKSNLPSTQK